MSFIYFSILAAVRLGRTPESILEDLVSQSKDDPAQMISILSMDLIRVIRDLENAGVAVTKQEF